MITPTPDMIAKIAQVAAVVAGTLEAIKQYAPQVKDNYAVAVNFLLSLALSFSVTHEINLQFVLTALFSAGTASGFYHIAKMAGGKPTVLAVPAPTPSAIVAPVYWEPGISGVLAGELVKKDRTIEDLKDGSDKLRTLMAAQMEYAAGRETAHQTLVATVEELKSVDVDHLNPVDALILVAKLHATMIEADKVADIPNPATGNGGIPVILNPAGGHIEG
jgi:hypothetical protein